MTDKVKRLMNFRYDRYRELETRLEKLAAKGLLLETCGMFFWTFSKGEPRRFKYAVTYFSEGSAFNPGITENQQTYFDYASAAGWSFVTQFNQMQIFCSEADNPIPFETDEGERLNNIKKCMKKSFVPSVLLLILMFSFNLVMQFQSFQLNPIEYLSSANRIFPAAMLLLVVLFEAYYLLDYFLWCKRSARSIASGGGCIERVGKTRKIIEVTFLGIILGGTGYFLLNIASEISWPGVLLCIAQVPILMVLFWSCIKYMKRKKASAIINRVLSYTVLTLACFAYAACVALFVIRFGFRAGGDAEYRTVAWPVTPTTTHEYRLYSQEIPLTCEDLYGAIDYDYYSYKKEIDSTLFLTKSNYRQDVLPAKDAPPWLEYQIVEPQFDFVFRLAKKHLLTMPEWRSNASYKALDNAIFQTTEAYQEYYEDTPMGKYILVYADKLVELNMREPLTQEQAAIAIEKLQLS